MSTVNYVFHLCLIVNFFPQSFNEISVCTTQWAHRLALSLGASARGHLKVASRVSSCTSTTFAHHNPNNMPPDNTVLQDRSVSLKKELKDWERKFADTHNGKKPGRDDIKADAAIGTVGASNSNRYKSNIFLQRQSIKSIKPRVIFCLAKYQKRQMQNKPLSIENARQRPTHHTNLHREGKSLQRHHRNPHGSCSRILHLLDLLESYSRH